MGAGGFPIDVAFGLSALGFALAGGDPLGVDVARQLQPPLGHGVRIGLAAWQIDKVPVLHDFDVSGFSIFGTLSTDGRRYTFENELPIVDIGLRLADVVAMDLQSEPVETQGSWEKRAETLAEHGATEAEVAFLRSSRVELNAMPADVFIDFLERKLAEHGVRKVVPDRDTLVRHARHLIEQRLADKVLSDTRAVLQAEAASAALPQELEEQVRLVLVRSPELSWDLAVAPFSRTRLREGSPRSVASPPALWVHAAIDLGGLAGMILHRIR